MANIKTLPEAAKLLEINEKTLRQAAKSGRVPATKSGKAWLLDLDNEGVRDYKALLKPKPRIDDENLGNCPVCGTPLPRQRAKYCSRECYAKTF